MPLGPGARLGSYEIVGPLGAGGMGEVYRARDSKLKREVAIKVLPETFSHDADRVERLRREAEVLASLNHPRIAAIYDLVESGAAPFLVLELVEGETLADRLARGPVGREEALEIAAQIAEAAEAAHDRGVIHRDLKPANIKITADAQVKVLDFGLAKLHRGVDGPSQSDVSTIMSTTPGLILGTAAYMSPEQANGAEATRASDMWSFGSIFYEMLAGRRAFEGSTMSEVLANVLKTVPDWQRLPADTPEPIRRLLRRALQKDPKLRARDMRDARLEIDDARNGASEPERAGSGGSARRERLAWASALVLVAVIAGISGIRALRPAPEARELRLDLNTPPTRASSLALSPDGRSIVLAAGVPSRLWLRSLDSPAMRPLAGTERGSNPFWSPDGRSIGFFADSKLKRVDLDGGSLQLLAPGGVPLGGTWSSDGTILFGDNPGGPILRMPAGGGYPVPATRIATAQQRGHAFPKFLPDGRHFLFYSIGGQDARGVYVGQLDDLNATRLFLSDGPAIYMSTGHLLFVRDGKLWAQGFDPDSRKLSADPFVVAEGVSGGTAISASNTGSIAYRSPPADSGQRQLVWVDRSGRETTKEVYADIAALGPALSPDRRRIAVYRESDGNMDIWFYEMGRRAWDRITLDPGDDIYPVWSPDGASVMFGAVRSSSGIVDLYRQRVRPVHGAEELLLATPQSKFPTDWSRDGRFILYDSLDPRKGSDLWALPLEGEKKPLEVVRTDFNESQGQFSPNVRWIAYQSDRTGRKEIYLRPFPGPGEDRRVSIDGGSQPRWNGSGDELFFIGGDDRLMAVPMRVGAAGQVLEPGVPVGLFATTVGSTVTLAYRQQYLAAADGRSFVMHSAVADGTASPISVILNWRPRHP